MTALHTIRTLEARVRRLQVLTIKHIDRERLDSAMVLMAREDRTLWHLGGAYSANLSAIALRNAWAGEVV